ncbi:hypothetical protein BJ322DRAFT_430754 [Thelephora terrestris]|uniref:Uncharacterized protein n=1 Tax=Thelephora terrestris TaxID=56493 RepID=A0A9P6HNE5_9AGAM|nr:hypothetical protein BJ322DRAFT_430754 [Thelephora terrestris]
MHDLPPSCCSPLCLFHISLDTTHDSHDVSSVHCVVGSLPVISPSFLVYFPPWLRCYPFHFLPYPPLFTPPPLPFIHVLFCRSGSAILILGSLYDIVENGMFLRTDTPGTVEDRTDAFSCTVILEIWISFPPCFYFSLFVFVYSTLSALGDRYPAFRACSLSPIA